MTSLNKFKKARNSYCLNVLKSDKRFKHIYFYDAKQRHIIKNKEKIHGELYTD